MSYPPTCHPHHDEDLSQWEASGLHSEDLQWVVCDRDVGQSGNALKPVRRIKDQQAEEDDEGRSVGHKLHEGAAQDFTQLETFTQQSEMLAHEQQGVHTYTTLI